MRGRRLSPGSCAAAEDTHPKLGTSCPPLTHPLPLPCLSPEPVIVASTHASPPTLSATCLPLFVVAGHTVQYPIPLQPHPLPFSLNWSPPAPLFPQTVHACFVRLPLMQTQ